MAGTPNSAFSQQNAQYNRILQYETFDDSGYTNNLSLTKARMTNPDSLNPVITHLMGKESKKFPLLYLTEGQKSGMKYVEISDVEYDWPVIGRMRKTDAIVGHDYTATDKPGYGGSAIYVVYKTRWLKPQHRIVSPNGKACRVVSIEPVSTGYKYKLDLIRSSNTDYVPLEELKPNTLWAMVGGANVSESYSSGNESNKQMPGKLKNQIGIIRKSYEIGGNVSNKVTTFNLPNSKGGTDKHWLPFEEYQHEMAFKEECEESLWESTYNRDVYGNVMTIDEETQLPIPYGAGLKQQIPNRDTYGILTLKKFKSIVSDVMYGATDADQMNIVMFTGLGGKEEFSNAIQNELNGWNLYDGALNGTIDGAPMNLVFGTAFTRYRHIDGHMITVAHLPYLDHGGIAQNAPLHPISGRPLTSYEMHFVDMSTYDGENNVQMIAQKGRTLIRGKEQGMALIKNANYGDYNGNTMDINLATDQDKTSIHYLKTLGVAVRRNTHCFSLYCVAN